MTALATGLLLLAVSQAHAANLYWLSYDSGNSRVGRANVDGTGANGSLVTGGYFSSGIASNGQHVFWGESGSSPTMGRVGRATIDGADVDHSFINAGTFCSVFSTAANATHVYFLKATCAPGGRTIGRAGVDGTDNQTAFIASANYTCGIAIDSAYVYWSVGTYIGRAGLDGSAPNNTWLNTGSAPCGLAVTPGHVYWTVHQPGAGAGEIGRATIDGDPASVNNTLVTGATFTGSESSPSGIAADNQYIYWANQAVAGTMGRAGLDGTGADQTWLSGVFYALGVARDPLATTPPADDPPADDPPADDPPVIPPPPPPGAQPPPAAAPARPVVQASTAVTPPRPLGVADVLALPNAKRCASRRTFRIRIRKPAGTTIARAEVSVNRKRVQVVRGARLTAPVNLRTLPKGRFTVAITVVTADGRKLTGTRRYRTCAKKKRSAKSKSGPL